MKTKNDPRKESAKTPQEKTELANAKNKWRSDCRSKSSDWTKRSSSRKVKGKTRINL